LLYVASAVTAPDFSRGIQDQFWLQIEESSASFQGIGVNRVPAAPPTMNFMNALRSKPISAPLSRYLWQTWQALLTPFSAWQRSHCHIFMVCLLYPESLFS